MPSLLGATARSGRANPDGRQVGTIFDQGVRGQAMGCLVPLEVASVLLGHALALLIAPVDLALCLVRWRPWPVTARRVGRVRRRHTWLEVGWRDSSTRIDEIVHALRTGRHLPTGEHLAT
jgi:hypothetical protein